MHRSRLLLPTGLLAIVVLAATGTVAGAASVIKPRANIAKAHKILFCSDVTYPPEEFYRGSTPAGSDIDIGTAAARLMGVKAGFANTGFDAIIPALLSGKCDAIISGMNDTPARRKQVSSRTTSRGTSRSPSQDGPSTRSPWGSHSVRTRGSCEPTCIERSGWCTGAAACEKILIRWDMGAFALKH